MDASPAARPSFRDAALEILRTLHLQPVVVHLAATSAGVTLVPRLAPRLLPEACPPDLRGVLVAVSLVLFVAVVPPLVMTAVHLGYARRRLGNRLRPGFDLSFALMLLVSAAVAAPTARRLLGMKAALEARGAASCRPF